MVKESSKKSSGFFRRLFGSTSKQQTRIPTNDQSLLSHPENGVELITAANNQNTMPVSTSKTSISTLSHIAPDIPSKAGPINNIPSSEPSGSSSLSAEFKNRSESMAKREISAPPTIPIVDYNLHSSKAKPVLAIDPISPFIADFTHTRSLSKLDDALISATIKEADNGEIPEQPSTNSTATDLTTPNTPGITPTSSLSSIHPETATSPQKSVNTTATITDQLTRDTAERTAEQSMENENPNIGSSLAESLYNHTATFVSEDEYASWLGDDGENQRQVLSEYMDLFDFQNKSILSALRILCDKLYMKGESQQLNRVIESFSQAWVSQNPNHGFHDANVVYTITYALVLLNTDLYAADHTATKKMSRAIFVQNTLETVRSQRPGEHIKQQAPSSPNVSRRSEDFSKRISIMSNYDNMLLVQDNSLDPMSKEWEFQLESILKSFYMSVSKEALKLHILEKAPFSPLSRVYSPTSHDHSPSITSTGPIQSSGTSIFGRINLGRLRGSKIEPHQSRIIDRPDRFRNDSLASSYSFKTSSFTNNFGFNRHAVGFAGLLWNSMIKEEDSVEAQNAEDDDFADFSKIEKELADEMELELQGAPWAKEGILLYRPYVDPSTGKKPKKKDWSKIFMVVQRGQLKMFKFDLSSSSHSGPVNGALGGGNWMENAQLVDGFHLCHTMAQELPPLKKTNGFTAVWSLTLPQRGLLVFQAGTPEVAREFVYTCNYWAGRLSKEPFEDSVSNMEFGWGAPFESNSIVSNTLTPSASTSALRRAGTTSRILPGDRLAIKEWKPSGHNMVVSDLNEEKQLKTLQDYIQRAENDLTEHNLLAPKLAQVYTHSSPNWNRAHTNWERKSQFLLQQVIRYKTYVESLDEAIKDRIGILPSTQGAEPARSDDEPAVRAFNAAVVKTEKTLETSTDEKDSSITVKERPVLIA